MGQYLGKLHETTILFPNTDIWMDSCGEEELAYGLARGIKGATSNPLIVGAVVKKELAYWEPQIQALITENPSFDEDEITWALIDAVGRERSAKLLPIFEQYCGQKGRFSIQTNAKYYRNADKMLAQALHLNRLGLNMQVKMPASAAGIHAMEEATYQGVSINATISFTVAQAVAVAQAVERGLARRVAEGLSTAELSPVCTLMIGRTDDWMKEAAAQRGLVTDPEIFEWAGIAVFKEAYRIYQERGYLTRLLSAANRNHYHWSALIGGNLCQTINDSWHKRLNACDIEVVSRISEPVSSYHLSKLMQLPEFVKSFNEKGMDPDTFEKYGGFRNTLSAFISGYEDLVHVIRRYMI